MIPLLLTGLASAQPPSDEVVADVAVAIAVEGEVTFKAGRAAPAALPPFSKVRLNDTLTVPSGGRIELVYFTDGHSETFAGPLELVVGRPASPVARHDGDALVGEALRELPGLVRRAELDKGGHTLLRGSPPDPVPLDDEEQARVDAARAHFAALRSRAAPSDVAPDLYLATVLFTLGQDAAGREVLEEARARCHTCGAPTTLLAAFEPRG